MALQSIFFFLDEFSGMVTSTPLVKSDEKQATTSKSASVVDEESPVLQHQLQLAVEVGSPV